MQKRLIKQKWHPYWKWEEVSHNMWGSVDDREAYIQNAIAFTGNHKRYGKYMRRVVKEWKYSCEHNLSNITQNRRAWIGHAAAALALRCPEDIVREAWWHLTDQQRELANNEADKAIDIWEKNQ
jgi:hypothetical protein